jgi:hypothetical protein
MNGRSLWQSPHGASAHGHAGKVPIAGHHRRRPQRVQGDREGPIFGSAHGRYHSPSTPTPSSLRPHSPVGTLGRSSWSPPDAASTLVRELATIRNFGPLDRRSGPRRPMARCHLTTPDPRWLGHGPWSNPATQDIGSVRCPRERTGAVPDPHVPGRPPPHRRPRPTGSLPRWSGRVRPALHRGRRCR